MVSKESSYLFASWLVPVRAPLWSLVTLWAAQRCGLIVVHGPLICSLVRKDKKRKKWRRREKVEGGKGR